MELPQYMFHLLKKEGFLACIIVMPSVYPPGNERIYVVDALRGIAPIAPAAVIPFDPEDAWAQVPDFADFGTRHPSHISFACTHSLYPWGCCWARLKFSEYRWE